MSQCCNNLDSEICSFSASQSLAARCAGRTTLHLDCTAPTWAGISVVYRAISGKSYAETDGNRRKQVETDGNTRNRTEFDLALHS